MKGRSPMKKCLFLMCLLSTMAHADILFININNNAHELEYLEKIAQNTNQKLITIPSKEKAAIYLKNKNVVTNSPFLPLDQFNIDSFIEEFNEVVPKYDIEHVVVSGHSDGKSYSGEFGTVSTIEFIRTFINYNEGKNQKVKSLYLLGCYSLKEDVFFKAWMKAFPDLKFALGTESVFRLGSNPATNLILKTSFDVVNEIDSNGEMKGRNELHNKFKKFKSARHNLTIYQQDSNKDFWKYNLDLNELTTIK